jgi:transcription initiation factor TFIIH subunit 2
MCPRCGVKLCDVPTDCEVCGLMVVSSPHLARSFWLLFPVAAYKTLSKDGLEQSKLDPSCFGCNEPFALLSTLADAPPPSDDSLSPTGRYRCAKCEHDFCSDCDMFVHETLHTCPGCSQ